MEKRDYIEKLIEKNLEALNDNEPFDGHFQRFDAKLKKLHAEKKKTTFSLIWKTAAAAVLGFFIVSQSINFFTVKEIENSGSTLTFGSISPECQEVEFYFINTINAGLKDWDKMMQKGLIPSEEQHLMENEMQEFEKTFEQLKKDLAVSPNDERVIHAMLEYYQTKLNLIQMIIRKLEETIQKNNISHEKEI